MVQQDRSSNWRGAGATSSGCPGTAIGTGGRAAKGVQRGGFAAEPDAW